MKSYTFKCVRADGPSPAIHIDTCEDDDAARERAMSLLEIWPLAAKVDVAQGERHFEVPRA